MAKIGARVSWLGDFSNAARSGSVVAINGDMVTIEWTDGTRLTQPAFVVTGPRWKVT